MHKPPPRPNRLRELREARGESRKALVPLVDRDTATISRWEQGATIPDASKFVLADHYGVTLDHLLGFDREAA